MDAFDGLLLAGFVEVGRTEDRPQVVQVRHPDVCWVDCLDWVPEPRHKTVACSVAFERRCKALPGNLVEESFELVEKLVVAQRSVVDLAGQMVPEEIDMMHVDE